MDSLAGRANQFVLLGAAVACAAAIYCLGPTAINAAEGELAPPVVAVNFPVASDVRLAGDNKRTRFILDLDKNIPFRAFALADPYRVVVDLPRSRSSLRPAPERRGAG